MGHTPDVTDRREPIVLQCCPNGSRPGGVTPALPNTPETLARDASAVAALGVRSFHVHPRDEQGRESLETRVVADTVRAIRQAAPAMEIGIPLARWVEPNAFRRTELVQEWARLPRDARPDVVAVSVHERGWETVCEAVASVGLGIELGVWTTVDAVQLRVVGVPVNTVRVAVEVTVTDPDTAVVEAVRMLRELRPMDVPVLLHGEEDGAWPVLEYARRQGLDTRIGFEDTLTGPDGVWSATGNEELVRFALGAAVAPQFEPRRRRRRGLLASLFGGSRAGHRG
ncbi:3-keto-5-aminohexanoate cleavage protein [Actinomycetospora termitidis]|uniref:3-keto-5-aminohexanoate cleavage protein n=1 Tax=Actinomycetospora termitidis TaxID=3053470 RepID=A0ABT7MI33_9PSEU|nr:3-keto-5-aminohexanoate cleavage protein [Actinomycetospora sp. Odt1-22]MDL5159854.1 3-keto-5-aminohexanoate cleavage protein [Actinomycetospora sp. Odt1-22]